MIARLKDRFSRKPKQLCGKRKGEMVCDLPLGHFADLHRHTFPDGIEVMWLD
jgi:hypothetical protein